MARKTYGRRDNEIVKGWESYYRIAIKIASHFLSFYFPSREDLMQSAALAATVAQVGLGDETSLGELMPVIRKELKGQASAYGMRQRGVVKADGRKSMQTIRADYPFTAFFPVEEYRENRQAEYLESRNLLVGVGEWSRRMSRVMAEL